MAAMQAMLQFFGHLKIQIGTVLFSFGS